MSQSSLRRRNLFTAAVLVAVILGVPASIFIVRFSHLQPIQESTPHEQVL